MGVSFKVSRKGWRYRPRVPAQSSGSADPATPPTPPPVPDDGGEGAQEAASAGDSALVKEEPETFCAEEREASFSINLYADGFSIGKPAEGMLLPLVQDAPKVLHPYDRTAMTLLNAIKTGWLPGDLLDDLPCKYYNGSIICEVWDFRTFKYTDDVGSLTDEFPFFQKVQLKMGMENVIKDLSSISNDSWSYDDLLQAEARITKVMQPVLHLDPTPPLTRASASPVSNGIDLHIPFRRPDVKHRHELTISKKFPNVLCGGDASRNGNFKSPTLISMSRDSSGSCAKHTTTKCTELDLHQQDFWDNDLDRSKIVTEVDQKQEINYVASAKNVIGASGTLHVEKDLRVSCLGMNSETLPRKRRGYEFNDIQPTWKSLLKSQKIEHLESSPHNRVMNQRHTMSDHGLQWQGIQFLHHPKVYKSKHQCLGDLKHPKLETSEMMNLILQTRSLMNFSINRMNVSSNQVLQCHHFQEHALDATAQSHVQHVIPEAMANVQQNNFQKCIIGHDLQMASLQKYKQSDSTSEASKVGLSVTYLNRDLRYSCPNVQTPSILTEKRQKRNDQQTSKFLIKSPKVEWLESAPHLMNTICDQGHQQNSNMPGRQLEAAKMLRVRRAEQNHSHMEVREEVFQDAQKAQPSTHFCLEKKDVQGEAMVRNTELGNFYMPVIGKGKIDGLSNLDGNMSGKVQYLPFSTSHLHLENPSNTQLSNSHMEEGKEVFEDVRKAV